MPGAYLDVHDSSLDEWLALVRNPPAGRVFARNHFPTDEHKREFLARVAEFSLDDVRMLLRHFLIPTGSTVVDQMDAKYVVAQVARGALQPENLWDHQRRLIRHHASGLRYPAWEGLHWVIDLLPNEPRRALAVLDAFMVARCQFLSDAYLDGLDDAIAIVRQRFVVSPGTAIDAAATLDSLDWRELEWMAGALYDAMGFATIVTPRSRDDGIDVLAVGAARAHPSRLIVQAKKKLAASKPVGKATVRELVGAMDLARATGGVLVTNGRFTSGAHRMSTDDQRIHLVDGHELVRLLNEHCGTDWYVHVARVIAGARRRAAARAGDANARSDSLIADRTT